MSRSETMKARWSEARNQQQFFNDRFGENRNVKDFWRAENPLTSKAVKYEITFKLDYTSPDSGYEFFIPQESFTVYSLKNGETQSQIQEQVKQNISNIFRGKSVDWVYNKLDVKVLESATIRGIEQEKLKYGEVQWSNLSVNGSYATNIPDVDVGKGKSRSKANHNKYDLNIWL